MSLTLIATTTVGAGGASSIDFTSIPATYTDLLVVASLRSTRSGAINDGFFVRFNGSSTAVYTTRQLQGNGGSAASYTYASAAQLQIGENPTADTTANTFGNGTLYIPNYAGSTNKSVSADNVGETNGTTIFQTLSAGLWANTAAITQVSLVSQVSNFAQYSTASLYGITKGSGGATVSP